MGLEMSLQMFSTVAQTQTTQLWMWKMEYLHVSAESQPVCHETRLRMTRREVAEIQRLKPCLQKTLLMITTLLQFADNLSLPIAARAAPPLLRRVVLSESSQGAFF